MFETLFKYPYAAFERGELLLLGTAPRWLLVLLIVLSSVGIGALLWARRARWVDSMRGWRLGALWVLEAGTVALLWVLLWRPALAVTELKPRQNIVAVLLDDSRSMALAEGGATREQQAVQALQGGVLTDLQSKFQTRLYRLDTGVKRVADPAALSAAVAPATHIGSSLEQLVTETADLPLGAVVLLSDGGDNAGGIDRGVIESLRNRRIPVYTVGFGAQSADRDIEVEDVVVASRTLAGSRLSATVKFQQQGFSGRSSALTVRDGSKLLASNPITFGPDGQPQTENVLFNIGAAGARSLQFAVEPLAGEVNRANNTLSRLVYAEPEPQRILYFEGEPRWEYKFIRRAAGDDPMIQVVSMLRTTENKIYRQNVQDPQELAQGFPTRPEALFGYHALIIGSVEATYFTPGQRELI
ncbi:MAG: glutamine amidotransferase, partial [Terriglobales bacterium]